jgi:hypothetical protein
MDIQQARATAREILNREGKSPNLDRLEVNIAAALLDAKDEGREQAAIAADVEWRNAKTTVKAEIMREFAMYLRATTSKLLKG